MVTIRRGRVDDAQAFLGIRNIVFPFYVNSVEAQRHHWTLALADPRTHLGLFAAERGGEMVGFVRAAVNVWTSEPGFGQFTLVVHPDAQGEGVGTALLERAEEHLRAEGARIAQTWSSDDPRSLRWCAARGYEPTFAARSSLLDPRELPPMPPTPEGATVATFAELGPQAVYPVYAESSLDVPGDAVLDALDYDKHFLPRVWRSPDLIHDASIGIVVDGRCVAFTSVEADRPTGRAWAAGSGTLRAYRGRGFVKLAKSASLRRVAALGIDRCYTANDETNAGMLAINEWLGYQPVATQWSQRKEL